jgi:hypothetical protein
MSSRRGRRRDGELTVSGADALGPVGTLTRWLRRAMAKGYRQPGVILYDLVVEISTHEAQTDVALGVCDPKHWLGRRW